MTSRSSIQSSRRAIFSFLVVVFLAYSHWRLQNSLVFVRVVSIFGTFFRAGEKTFFLLIAIHFCVLKMFVHPDGASTTVRVTLHCEKCETWTNASLICRSMGANLPAIESQEENVYVQHRHNGDKAWIGLNDIATEGVFAWVDGCPFKFRYWAQNQPNNFREEDCVHTLGPGHVE